MIANIAAAESRVRDAGHLRSFRHAVRDFITTLSGVTDGPAASLDAEGLRALQTAGEDVIDLIEERIDDIASVGDAQELAAGIYEIRRLLEETARWRHHYELARHV